MDNKLSLQIEELIGRKEYETAKIYLLTDLKIKVKDYDEEERLVDTDTRQYLAHYTSLETIYSIISNNEQHKLDNYDDQEKKKLDYPQDCKQDSLGYLRLYDSQSLNDPDEGDYLKKRIHNKHQWLKKGKQKTSAFICSFVSGGEDIGDKLQYWQSYGVDGLGCSIQPSEEFLSNAWYRRVKYGQDGIADIDKKFQTYFRLGKDLYRKLPSNGLKGKFATEFWGVFDRIKFLYKNDDYNHEKEFRCVVIPDIGEVIGYDFKTEGPYLRRYKLHKDFQAKVLLASGSKIIIGPRVQDKERVCLYLKELAVQSDLEGVEFIPSVIPYQKLW